MTHLNTSRKSNAFTLVELLVVIGIIAVLIGILLPSLNKARGQARTVQCASNLRQLAVAMLQYVNANKGKLPPCRVPDTATIYPQGWFWPNELVKQRYIQMSANENPDGTQNVRSSAFFCPEGDPEIDAFGTTIRAANATYPRDARNNASTRFRYGDTVIATWYMVIAKPTASTTKLGGTKDAPFIIFQTSGRNTDDDLRDSGFSRPMARVKLASEVVMMADGSEATAGLASKYIAARHGIVTNGGRDGGSNFAFFDGHVTLVPTAPFTKAVAADAAKELTVFNKDTIFFLSNQKK